MPSRDDAFVVERCLALENSCTDAIDWVGQHVPAEQGKESSQNKLKDARRLAKKLKESARRRPCLALYGPSQSGKSFLVANLVKTPEMNSAQVEFPGKGLVDFIEAVNPRGNNKEATGLVTRFSTSANIEPGRPPVRLTLLSQLDVAKILANAYFSDLVGSTYSIEREPIHEMLASLSRKAAPHPIDGVSEGDVLDLRDYLWANFSDKAIVSSLKNMDFWDGAARVIPRLPATERWKLMQYLWGELTAFTEIFKKLSDAFKSLGCNTTVFCQADALIPKETMANTSAAEGEVMTPCSIIDVGVIKMGLVGEDRLPPVDVSTPEGDRRSISRSVLSAVTAEITLRVPQSVANCPELSFLRHADVLDFPGARTRKIIQVENLIASTCDPEDIVEAFLRGKVAYLFQHYNQNCEISALLLCLDTSQQNVNVVAVDVGEWVFATHGATAEERAGKKPRLFVALTKFNEMLVPQASDIAGQPSCHDTKWSNRLDSNFAEFLSFPYARDKKWPINWAPGEAFTNCYWIRDPRYSWSIYEGADAKGHGKETGLQQRHLPHMQDLERSYLGHPIVRRHFRNPKESWDEATQPGKTGMSLLLRDLAPECDPQIKRDHLLAKCNVLAKDVCSQLKGYYTSPDAAKATSEAEAKGLAVARSILLAQQNTCSFGILLDHLHMNEDLAWQVYYNIENPALIEADDTAPAKQAPPMINMDMSTILDMLGKEFSDAETSAAQAQSAPASQYKDKATLFAETLVERWRRDMELPPGASSAKDHTVFGLTPAIYTALVMEISRAAGRLGLAGRIAERVKHETNKNVGSKNIDLIARLAVMEINGLINTLGWGFSPLENRPVINIGDMGQPIFIDRKTAPPKVEELNLNVTFPGNDLFVNWIKGAQFLFKANLGYGARDNKANSLLAGILEQVACSG